MKPQPAISLKMRFAVVIVLWLAASIVPAIFAEVMLEYDGPHTELRARVQLVLFAPLVLAHGLAWAITPGYYNQWPARELGEFVLSALLCCVLIAQAWFTLTRKTWAAFAISSSAHAAVLLFSAFCLVRYWHWDYHNMHA